MKSLTIHTLVMAVAVALWGTASLAVSGELSSLPVSQSQKDTPSAAVATSSAPFHALSRLDTQSLAAQAMTDQELKAVEGGGTAMYIIDLGVMGHTTIFVGVDDPLQNPYIAPWCFH